MMNTISLRNANLVSRDREIEGASVLIEDGSIVEISAGGKQFTADEVIDVSNASLYPGFIDVHIHGAVGVDANAADAEALHRVASFLAHNGVTAWLPTLVPDSEDNYRKAVGAVDELMRTEGEREPAARALGVHYEGPFVSERQCGALHTEFFKTFSGGDELKSLPRSSGPGAVHMTTLAPEIEGGIQLVEELTRQGWVVSIGHTRAPVDVLDRAQRAGARHMTHFMNAMSPLHHREPGPVAWGLLNDRVGVDLIADGVHLDPLVLQLVLRCKTASRVSLISDAVAPTGLGDGDFSIWGETIAVRDGRTRNARGSIAGSVITMLDAARRMLSLGVPPWDVARMASTNPARLLGVDQTCGSLEEGKRADLVALDDKGNVRLTLIGGKIAFEK
ncbi:MAG TPA: N-acetylglucosamine-6-phosphate deacetylase [Pyrinomonadaceae bacterium]|nr:N-acetylglucosamine-6-phosphate deacetylase [Pyrinomonadaceae bacterium]